MNEPKRITVTLPTQPQASCFVKLWLATFLAMMGADIIIHLHLEEDTLAYVILSFVMAAASGMILIPKLTKGNSNESDT